MPKDRRRYSRHRATIKTVLRERVRSHQLTTADVSRHGVFLVTDTPKAERQLVQLTFDLPDGPLDVMGMVARAVCSVADGGAKPGMGIDFFAFSREAKSRWDAFIQAPPDGAKPNTPESTRRRNPRHVSCFLVRMRNRDRLREYYTRDISAGGTLLRTPSPDEVSKAVDMILVHPETDAEFPLSGQVVRRVRSPALAKRGVAVQFEALDRERENALLAFIETGVNFLGRSPEARQEKIELLKHAAQAAPRSPIPMVALGQSLIEIEELSLAIEAFNRALALDDACLGAHRGLYEAYTALEAYSRAHQHLVVLRRHEKRD